MSEKIIVKNRRLQDMFEDKICTFLTVNETTQTNVKKLLSPLLVSLDLMGPCRERNFIKFIAQKLLSNPKKWEKLIEFLENVRNGKPMF